MLAHIGFFIAGFFWPALPWAPVAAAALQLTGLLLSRREQLTMWWRRSKPAWLQLIALQLGLAAVINTALMLLANAIRWMLA